MPNIGRPSRGCGKCKRRRVKCDLRKPGCLRCEKIKHVCPGYERPEKWLFVGQKPQDDESQTSESSTPSLSSDKVGVAGPAEIASKPIAAALPGDIEAYARSFFAQCFISDGQTSIHSSGHLQYLPKLLSNASADSCLKHAFTAVALANLANRRRPLDYSLDQLIIETHSKALHATKEQLSNGRAYLDETLATIHLMTLYELLSPSFMFNSWTAHVHGATKLLCMRGPEQLDTASGRQLFGLVLTPVVLQIMRSGELPSSESVQTIRDMQSRVTQGPGDPFPRVVASFWFEVAIFSAQTRQIFLQGEHSSALERISWIQRGESLEISTSEQISSMMTTVSMWHPQWQHDIGDLTKQKMRRLLVMAQWIRYWTAQLCLYNVLSKLAAAIPATYHNRLSWTLPVLLARSHCAGEGIIRCIPFATAECFQPSMSSLTLSHRADLGQSLGALAISYALEMICTFSITNEEHKQAAREGLMRIRLDSGIGRIHI